MKSEIERNKLLTEKTISDDEIIDLSEDDIENTIEFFRRLLSGDCTVLESDEFGE